MAVMTAQPPLPVAPVPGVEIGPAVLLVEDADGGRVFLQGNLIHAWDAWGERMVERLRGMFAFAIWDARRRFSLVRKAVMKMIGADVIGVSSR